LALKDYIILTGLKISCIIGIFNWEREQKQEIIIDLKFPCDIRKAAKRDNIVYTFDYKKIAKSTIAFVEKSKFQLVETLAESLAQFLIDNFHLPEVHLTVSKPGAIRGSQNVGIQIYRSKASTYSNLMTFLSLGSNIQPKQNLGWALREIQNKYSLEGLSHVYETSPVGYTHQSSFWNLVVAINTRDKPENIRKWIEELEKKGGRIRMKNAFGPRTLDVDLILWRNLVKKYKTFSLPHPDIQTKAFVLFPLLEVCPDLVHPKFNKSLIEIASEFKNHSQKIKRLPSDILQDFLPENLKK
jgi:2-amino-4-hydroxy-6-hydroxymethyldihydropteridine diphosphokinase